MTVRSEPHPVAPLADRVEFETLISDTSATLVAASPPDVDAAIESALERVRLFFDADRCGFMKVSVGPDTAHVTHGAYGPEIPHVSGELNVARLFPWSHQRLSVEHQPVVVSRMADLPPEAAVDRATWQHMGGVRSSLVVPVVAGASVAHLIVIALLRSERDWPGEYVPRLRVLGEMMANALLRAQTFAALQTAHAEVKRLRDQLEQENMYLRREVSQSSGGDLIVGRSPAIRQALALAEQVAVTTSTVLLLGVTGTGKERFASFIHHTSPRRGRPMVRVNCSAIPISLIESELFGRERGAYTGAMSKQIGRFELAHGSTLFLDLTQPGKWTLGTLFNQIWSTSGAANRADVNAMYLQPFANYNLGGGLAVGASMEATANWDADETWTAPLLFSVSKVTLLGKQPVSSSVAAGPMIASPAGGADWRFRLVGTFLFPR